MKSAIYCFILAAIATEVAAEITKEKAMSKVTVRLIRKDWRPLGFNPSTEEPLHRFPGNYTDLRAVFRTLSKGYGYVKRPLVRARELFYDRNYNASQPTLVLTHPMAFRESQIIAHIVGVLSLRNLHKHYNIFAMHAPWLSWQFQMSCARVALGLDPKFKPVAEAFASFLLDGIALGRLKPYHISFIGFSASATLNAYIAREIRDRTGNLTHTLMTLDAFQYNNNNRFFKPVSREDAMFVHMFHSSARFGGTIHHIGTVDIVINNGYFQPGCQASKITNIGCSHRRSAILFVFSVLAHGNLVARKCDSWEDFTDCKCSTSSNPLLVVSFPVNEEARGTFYVRTRDRPPFILGPAGADCVAEVGRW